MKSSGMFWKPVIVHCSVFPRWWEGFCGLMVANSWMGRGASDLSDAPSSTVTHGRGFRLKMSFFRASGACGYIHEPPHQVSLDGWGGYRQLPENPGARKSKWAVLPRAWGATGKAAGQRRRSRDGPGRCGLGAGCFTSPEELANCKTLRQTGKFPTSSYKRTQTVIDQHLRKKNKTPARFTGHPICAKELENFRREVDHLRQLSGATLIELQACGFGEGAARPHVLAPAVAEPSRCRGICGCMNGCRQQRDVSGHGHYHGVAE